MAHKTVLLIVLLGGVAACGSDATSDSDRTDPSAAVTTTADVETTSPSDGSTLTDGSAPTDDPPPTTVAPLATEPTTAPPTPIEGSPTSVPSAMPRPVEPLYAAGDIDAGLQPFIDQATEDLAARLDADVAAITTHAAVLVVWPDASLGCPQPDMRYAQVLTDGSVIELALDGKIYRYHTGGDRGPFVCEQPLTKTPPTELDIGGGIDY